MKLYFAPGACSSSDLISLYEANLSFETEKVDLGTKKTESGADYLQVNAKGYVPALVLDTGETLTENVAILDWIAQQDSALKPSTAMDRSRLIEALAYISAELHGNFSPFFAGAGDDRKQTAREAISKRLRYMADTMAGEFLLSDHVSVADYYLLVMLRWSANFGVEVPAKLADLQARLTDRPAVKKAMEHEQLV